MKITFVLPGASLAGGVRVVAIYARKLIERGHEVTVLSRGWDRPSLARRIHDLLRHRRWPGRGPGSSVLLDFLGDRHIVIHGAYPLDPARVPDADAIIATWWETAFAVSALPRSKGRPFYFIQHHEVHRHLPWHLSRGSYFLPMRKITIARWLVETMATLYGDTEVDLVENSVDTTQFHAPERGRNAVPTVGFLYSPDFIKGVDVSLKAIEIARSRVPGLRVVAFGAHEVDPAVPLPEGTEFHHRPDQEAIRNIYAACDVWLCGSRTEGFHLPPLEAMACRCPVVSTRIGGAVETVTDGVNGYLADQEDSATLGERLADVLRLSADDWKAMSDAAHDRARRYSWDDAADRFERFLIAGVAASADGPTGQPDRTA